MNAISTDKRFERVLLVGNRAVYDALVTLRSPFRVYVVCALCDHVLARYRPSERETAMSVACRTSAGTHPSCTGRRS
jgi:hypothetical protein